MIQSISFNAKTATAKHLQTFTGQKKLCVDDAGYSQQKAQLAGQLVNQLQQSPTDSRLQNTIKNEIIQTVKDMVTYNPHYTQEVIKDIIMDIFLLGNKDGSDRRLDVPGKVLFLLTKSLNHVNPQMARKAIKDAINGLERQDRQEPLKQLQSLPEPRKGLLALA